MPRLAALPALALVLALAGCGADSDSTTKFKGDSRAVAQTVEDLSEAGRKKDAKKICGELLAPAVVDRLKAKGDDCEAVVDEALDDADTFDMTVKKVDVKGTTATARVESGRDKDKVETLQLVKSGDAWKISSLG